MRLLPVLALTLTLAAPVQAQEEAPGSSLQGMLDDMMGVVNPWLADLVDMLGDLAGWHAPEFLPNGDILIRRRLPDEPGGQEPEVQDDEAPLAPGESLEL